MANSDMDQAGGPVIDYADYKISLVTAAQYMANRASLPCAISNMVDEITCQQDSWFSELQ